MRVSLNWVLEVAGVDAGTDPAEAARRLTAAGLEVESVQQVGHDIEKVVVAEVTEIEELTGFKKPVRYCQVDTGSGEPRGVICGAVNFAAGDRVPLALPGARLPGGFEIGARKTYGHISEGMICSAAELGIGEDHSGILVLAAGRPAGCRLRAVRRARRPRARHRGHPGPGLRALGPGRVPGAGHLLRGPVRRPGRR